MDTLGPLTPSQYLRLPAVRARIREFCGLADGDSSRCVYLAGMGEADGPHATWGTLPMRAPESLDDLLAAGRDVARSLWDTEGLLVHIDLDYVNATHPDEAIRHPADSFLKLEPVWRGLKGVLARYRIPLLDLVTGAGYGFVGRLNLRGGAVSRLAALAPDAPAWLATHEHRRPPWATSRIGETQAKAYQGLALVLEHIAHRVLARCAPSSKMPIVVNNAEAGRGPAGREFISIDLTYVGDPLDARLLRVAFGVYQKHRLRPDLVGTEASWLPPLAVVPRGGRPLFELLARGRALAVAARSAERECARIPDVEQGMLRLLDDYADTALARWHRGFHTERPHPPADWPSTYLALDPAGMPPCVAACLLRPNDLLLKPTHLQMLVRFLMAHGWHPRHVAGLVHAHYARAGLWGDHWRRGDPATRAASDVRMFAGLIATGCDEGVDFNCVSTQEKGLCPGRSCSHDLRLDRDHLLARVVA